MFLSRKDKMLEIKKSESIKFKASVVIYNNELGFKIIKGFAYDEDGKAEIGKCSLKGYLYDVEAGDEVFTVGHWEDHPQYGMSFMAESYVKSMPKTKASILNYLKQGNIAGISKTKAELIVNIFEDKTLDVLLYQTDLLSAIKGIGQKTIDKIQKSAQENLAEQSQMMAIMMYIQSFDISPAYAKRIYDKYGIKSMDVIKENPYRLADEVKGIGFLKADEIALRNGIKKDSPFRVESAILYTMSQMNDEGDVYSKYDDVVAKCKDFLELNKSYINDALDRLITEKRIIDENKDLYLPKLYYAEVDAASKLIEISHNTQNSFYASDNEIESMSKAIHIKYADAQVSAIKAACSSNVIVITGGPGTGKTTVTNGIIRLCQKHGLKVECAAPTGKAAKRMSEATGMGAKTIHKLLEMKYDENAKKIFFSRNEQNPIVADVLVIDESSMIDIALFNSLLKAVPIETKLIIVGDIDQLPSVGCGNVLHDIIDSEMIPVERLSLIYRQGQQSDIVKNAHIINSGHTPSLKNKRDGDFFFIDTDGMDAEAIRDKIVQYVCVNLPKCYNISPENIQVLAPMKKGHTGVYELNSFIQDKLNPASDNKTFLVSNGNIFREGDRVMCTSNDYESDIFNGDVGKIVSIHKSIEDYDDDEEDNVENKMEKFFDVEIDGKIIRLALNKIDNFTLAYAMTIHKSQGSEYDIVVMPLTNQNYIMLQRNLLYTGLTRAKKIFVLVGQKSAIRTAVHTLKVVKRNTHLNSRLREAAGVLGLRAV